MLPNELILHILEYTNFQTVYNARKVLPIIGNLCDTCDKIKQTGMFYRPYNNSYCSKIIPRDEPFINQFIFLCSDCFILNQLNKDNSHCVECRTWNNSRMYQVNFTGQILIGYTSDDKQQYEIHHFCEKRNKKWRPDDEVCKICWHQILEENRNLIRLIPNIRDADSYCARCQRKWDENDIEDFSPDVLIHFWAFMLSDRVFKHGTSNLLKLEEKIIINGKELKYGDRLCNICLKDLSYQEFLFTPCDLCHQKYSSRTEWNYISNRRITRHYTRSQISAIFTYTEKCHYKKPEILKGIQKICNLCVENVQKDGLIKSSRG